MTLDRHAASTPPSSPWRQGWEFRSSAWSGAKDRAGDVELHTLATPGDFAPTSSPPPWSFHLGLGGLLGPPETRFLANGFMLGFSKTDPDAYLDFFMVSPGQLVGRGNVKISPSLFCPERDVHEEPGLAYVETPDAVVALRWDRFEEATRLCIAISPKGLEAALALSQQGLQVDLPAFTEKELRLRAPFWSHHRRTEGDHGLLCHALERLVYRLEPPAGRIEGTWVRGEDGKSPCFELRNLFGLVRAWIDIDAAVATSLVRTAVQGLTADGALPHSLHPATGPLTSCSTWPTLVSCAWLVRKAPGAEEFLSQALPRLHTYLAWAFSYFDPQASGTPCWRDAHEALIEDTFDENLCSADLAALLLREADFFFELFDKHPDLRFDVSAINLSRERITDHLLSKMWDLTAGVFHDHYLGGDSVSRITLSGVMPLLWPNLAEAHQKKLLLHVAEKGALRKKSGIAAWQPWENDPSSPPVIPAHQVLLLDRIRELQPPLAIQLALLSQEALRHCFSRDHAFPAQLSVSETKPDSEATAKTEIQGACLALLCASPLFRKHPEEASRLVMGMEKHRTLVGIVAIALLALLIGGASLRELLSGTLPTEEQAAAFGLIEQQMASKSYAEAQKNLDGLKGKVSSELLDFYSGLISFEQGDFAKAGESFRSAVEAEGRGEKARMNLALSLFRQGKLDEAEKAYADVIERYADSDPEIVQMAKAAQHVLMENRITFEQVLGGQEKDSPPAETNGESP